MAKLEWKITRFKHPVHGEVEVIHWGNGKINHVELVESVLGKKGVPIPDSRPPVTKHAIGKYELAVRDIDNQTPGIQSGRKKYEPEQLNPEKMFFNLVEMAARGHPIVEMPVALINHKDKSHVVSVWKKGTSMLVDFLYSSKNQEEKEKAADGAVEQMARLHALGYAHGHLMNNFTIGKNGEVKIIDYSHLKKGGDKQQEAAVTAFLLSMQLVKPGAKNDKEIQNRLMRKYEEYKNKFAKREKLVA
ncbi:hypothetical protein HY993_03810 [Candidatus Micrarchaeota archaeon]|nr:hypothetical protein [Candidatus Micrarchaeota archaeon]